MNCILTLAMVVFATVAFGVSDEEADRFRIGVQGGVNVFNANLSPDTTSDNIAGYTVGLSLVTQFRLGFLALQPELNYTQKGAENAAFGPLGVTRLDYVELPVMARANFSVGRLNPFLTAGPKVSYLVRTSSDAGVARGDFQPFDVAVDVGAGVGMRVAENDAFLSARYSQGLTDIDRTADSWTSQNVLLTAGMYF